MNCDSSDCENIIYQSGDTILHFTLKNCDKSPFSLVTGLTEIEVLFQTLISPPVILKLSLVQVIVTNAGGGQFTCTMSQANAMLLKTGLIDVEVRVTLSGEIFVTQILQELLVQASKFPGF